MGTAASMIRNLTLGCSALLRRTPRTFSSRPPVTSFSEDEQALQEMTRAFCADMLTPIVRKMDEEQKMDPDLLKGCFDTGLMGIDIPEEYGGSGMGFTASIIAIEELAKVDAAVSVMVDIHNTLINTAMMRYGNAEQKEKYLPMFATNTLGSFALSEANAGSDAFALKTTAVKDGDDYIINGTKQWISNASEAGVFLIMANANPEAKHRGITCFVVDAGTPGLTAGKKEDKLGIRASSTCELVLQDLRVPASSILGEFGQGYKIAIESLNEGRIGIGAQMVGLAQGAYDYALKYIHDRKQFGQPVADFQGMQFQYADIATKIEMTRLLVYNGARMKEAGLPFVAEAAMAKLQGARVAQETASVAVEWLGGVGFTREYDAEKFYRDAKIGSIYEGTSNMQLATIAKVIQAEYR